jgi:hypothetical protein
VGDVWKFLIDTISAMEVAPVGDRYPDVVDDPVEFIH